MSSAAAICRRGIETAINSVVDTALLCCWRHKFYHTYTYKPGPDAHKSGGNSRDQNKPDAGAGSGAASGKFRGYLQAATGAIAHDTSSSNNACKRSSNTSGNLATINVQRGYDAANTIANSAVSSNTPQAASTASDGGSDGNNANTQPSPQPAQLSSSATLDAAAATDTADTDGPVRTLSGAWSKIMASKAVAEALGSSSSTSNAPTAAAGLARCDTMSATAVTAKAGTGAGSTLLGSATTCCSRGSSDESLLTANDAVVHLLPAGLFRRIGEWVCLGHFCCCLSVCLKQSKGRSGSNNEGCAILATGLAAQVVIAGTLVTVTQAATPNILVLVHTQ